MADIRVKDLTEASVPGPDYYLLTDSATDGVKKVQTKNVVKPADIGAASLTGTETLTSKTIDASSNTISNLTTAMFATNVVDNDGTLAANSSTRIPTQAAVKAYADQVVAATDAMVFKGVIDCSANPNYPAADRGWTYKVSVAGKIGGASGVTVDVGDTLLCLTDGTASGDQATVGANWNIVQANLVGAVTGPVSSTSGNIATFNGTGGKVIQDGGKALPAGAIVGTTDTQTLTNKDLTGAGNTFPTFNQNTTGSAAKLTTARNIDGQAFDGTANITVIAPGTHAATSKTTPVDADELPLVDSAASNVLKKLTWANLKAALSSVFASAAQGAKADSAVQSVVGGTSVSIDSTDPKNPIINVAGGGTVDQTAAYNWTGQHTFTKALDVNPTAASLIRGIDVEQTPHGSSTSGAVVPYNIIRATSDDASTPGSGTNIPLFVYHEFGGSNMQGARIGVMYKGQFTAASSASNSFREYVGVTGQLIVSHDDGGTGTSVANAKGSFFASNFWVNADAGVTNLLGLIGSEVNIAAETGASVNRKLGWNIVALAADAVQGVDWDAAYSVSSQTGAVGWKDGLLFNNANGQFPINSTGNVIRATSGSVANGVDFSALTISGSAFKSTGFSVDGSGHVSTRELRPGAGSFAVAVGKIYTSVGNTGTGLTITAHDSGSTGSYDFGFFSTQGTLLIANPHGTASIMIGNSVGTVGFGSGAFASNGSVATSLGSVGPTGSHTTVQKWFKINDGTNTYYIPAF